MLAFFNSTYHYFLRSIVNIFRLETGVSFFNTTYHDFLRCIVNIFRFEIGASFFFSYHVPRFISFHCEHLRLSESYHTPHRSFTAPFTAFTPTTLHHRHIPLPPPPNPRARKYHCLRWLFRRRHLGGHLQCVFCARSHVQTANFDCYKTSYITCSCLSKKLWNERNIHHCKMAATNKPLTTVVFPWRRDSGSLDWLNGRGCERLEWSLGCKGSCFEGVLRGEWREGHECCRQRSGEVRRVSWYVE